MKRSTQTTHTCLLAAAAAALLLIGTGARAGEDETAAASAAAGMARAQVRAELAEWRAEGLLDRSGQSAADDTVIAAREAHNATEARVLIARLELEQQKRVDVPGSNLASNYSAYKEAGPDGPVLVLIRLDGEGMVSDVESVNLASND